MKRNKFAYLFSKPLGNHTVKIDEKIPGKIMENTMEYCQSEKVEPCGHSRVLSWLFSNLTLSIVCRFNKNAFK